MSACLFTFILFITISLLTALTCDSTLLLHDCNYMSKISIWSPIVAMGVLLATFSASLNNMIGGSRVLEAVAKDVLFGPFLTYINKVSIFLVKKMTFGFNALLFFSPYAFQH